MITKIHIDKSNNTYKQNKFTRKTKAIEQKRKKEN